MRLVSLQIFGAVSSTETSVQSPCAIACILITFHYSLRKFPRFKKKHEIFGQAGIPELNVIIVKTFVKVISMVI